MSTEALLLAAAACEPDGRERALLLRSAALGAYNSLRFEHSVRLFRRALEATDDSEVRCSVLRTMVWPELLCGANARDLAAALRAAVDAVPADTAGRAGLIRAWGSLASSVCGLARDWPSCVTASSPASPWGVAELSGREASSSTQFLS